MTLLPALAALLVAAAPPPDAKAAAPDPGAAKFAAGQAAFGKGEFEKAVVQLDAAAKEAEKAANEPMLTKIHLLRGQCFAGIGNDAKASEAFLRALESDPAAALDPSAVRPSTIALLDKARAEARGLLKATVDQPGGEVYVDDQKIGPAPFDGPVAIGKHQVEVRAADGRTSGKQELLIRANKPTEAAFKLPEAAAVAPPPPPVTEEPKKGGLEFDYYADLRVAPQIMVSPNAGKASFFGELGVGGGLKYASLSAHVGFANASFALAFRLNGRLPEIAKVAGAPLGVHASFDVPALLVNGTMVWGLGGAVGADVQVFKWLEPFLELRYRHYLAVKDLTTDTDAIQIGVGARLRLP